MTKNNTWWKNGLAFECQLCGNCCAGPAEGYVWVTNEEMEAMATQLGLTVKEFKKQYCRRVGFRYSLLEKQPGKDCIFLPDPEGAQRGCEVYAHRPRQCRTWPFWPENLKSPEHWRHAAESCPGIDKGQWYSAEQIEAAAENGLETVQTRPIVQAAVEWLAANKKNIKALAAVEQVYRDIDEQLAATNPWCKNCGRCCDFVRYDHRLYATTLEILYLLKGLATLGETELDENEGTCPYQQQNKGCIIRPYRTAGCRIFFCQSLDPDYQHKLTEQALARLRELHQQFGAAYYYADLLEWLKLLR